MLLDQRWLVCLSAFLANLLALGVFFSMGTLLSDIMDTFNVTRAEAALVQSVGITVSLCFGFFHGCLVQTFGVRNVAICLSCCMSVGFGICFFATSITFLVISMGLVGGIPVSGIIITSAAAIGRHFHGKQGIFFVSFINVGSGLGGVSFPYLFNYLTDTFGLRGTCLITGGIFLHMIPLTLLWKPPITRKSRQSTNLQDVAGEDNKAYHAGRSELNDADQVWNSRTNKSDVIDATLTNQTLTSVKGENNTSNGDGGAVCTTLKKLLADTAYMYFAFGIATAYSCNTVFYVYVVDALQDSGFSEINATLGLLLMNLAGILGRFLPGSLTQTKHITVLKIPMIACIMIILSQLGLTLISSVFTNFLSCILAGTAIGMFSSTFGVATLKLVGTERQATAMGICLSLSGITNAVLGPIGGLIRDKTGSYTIPFLLSASVEVLAIVLLIMAQFYRFKDRRSAEKQMPVYYNTRF
ncbi:monocarboxylate transporter 12-like isoform X1 [Mya arenaria]|uniref:monocarboxylate transporter 12-like isoform X1 n=2 Tax=Mya arenaria TaxID=6604 RepID=UPI0022DF588D|nr:monocarboxylate transporter 12-like isoform X1 [Mya arenaria]